MRLLKPIGIFVLLIASCYCQNNRQTSDPTIGATPENLEAVSQSVTNLAQKISLAIANPKSKTEIFSPVSIAGALSLLLLGSGGETRDELMTVMGFKNSRLTFTDIHKSFGRLFQDLVSNEAQNVSIPWRENDKCNNYDYDDEDDYQPKETHRGKRDTDSHFISVANGVFVDNSLPLNSRYENLTKELYAGEIEKMALYRDPVGASNRINNWVQQVTRNKIRQIVSPEQVSNAPMVLASALYFKAKWETMFIEPDTRPRPFYLNGRNAAPIDIDTMATSGCFPFYEDKQHDAKIVGLPYQEGKSTMYIIVPNQSDRQKLRDLQNVMSLQDWDNRIDQMVVKTGTFLMPKMKIENALGLRDVLNHLGLRQVFNPERSDLTAITKDDPILNEMSRKPENSKPTKQSNPTANNRQTARPTTTPTTKTSPRPNKDHSISNINHGAVFQPTRQPYPIDPTASTISTNYHPTTKTTSKSTSGSTQQNNRELMLLLNASLCNMINYCVYKSNEDYCSCTPNQQLAVEQRDCRSKPLVVQHICPPDRLLFSNKYVQVCYVEWYSIVKTCHQGCYPWRDQCFCCSQYTHTSQQSISGQSVENQQSFIGHPLETTTTLSPIANRFGNHQEQPSYSTTKSPPVRLCKEKCNWFECWISCTLVNPNTQRRYRRQTGSPQLFVGDVLHKVSLDINEQGTEGGAVTAIVIDRISSSFNLRVDGPFLIYLRNDVTKLPLFYGAVFDPRS